MTVAVAPRITVTPDVPPAQAADGEALVASIRAFVARRGCALRVRPVGLDELPFEAWDHGASIRLQCAPGRVQDFVVFGPARSASAMVGWLFGYDAPHALPRDAVEDALGEALNQVVGRLKGTIVHTDEFQPWLETPELLGCTPSVLVSRVDPRAAAFVVSSDTWSGQMVFVCSPPAPRSVAAVEGAMRVLMRFGSDRDAMARVCRLLEDVRTMSLAPRAPRELKVKLSWSIETLAALVGSRACERREVLFHRVVRELDGLRVELLGLCASPPPAPYEPPLDVDERGLLADFCARAVRDLEDAEAWITARPDDLVHRLFRAVRRLAGDATFFGMAQLDRLADATKTVLAAARDEGGRLDAARLDIVRVSLELAEAWVDALEDALREGAAVEWSAAIDTHLAVLDDLGNRCVGDRLEAARGLVAKTTDSTLQLDPADALGLESLEVELSESSRTSTGVPDADALLARAHAQVRTICRSMRRVELARGLGALARHARETAARHGKLVRVDVFCPEVAVPEHLLAALSGPMVNLLDNAIEHGVEEPRERLAAAKPALASIEIRASWAEEWLTLEVVDDGRGIDRQGVLEAARRCGVTLDPAEHAQALELVLRSGVSTIGRDGLGLDVVRREVQRRDGDVEVTSMPGRETRVVLRVSSRPRGEPQTIAAAPADPPEALELDGALNFL